MEFTKISNLFNSLDKKRKHWKWIIRYLETQGLYPNIGKVVREYLDWGREKLSTLSGWWRYLYDHGFRRAKISKVFYNAKEQLQAYSVGRIKTGTEDLVFVAHYCSHKSCAKIIKGVKARDNGPRSLRYLHILTRQSSAPEDDSG